MIINNIKLDCGIDCKILNLKREEKKTYIALTVKSGSMSDNQYPGISHFLEHMLLHFEEKSNFGNLYIKGTTGLDKTTYLFICSDEIISETLYLVNSIILGNTLNIHAIDDVRKEVEKEYFEKNNSKTYKLYNEFIKDANINIFLPVGTIEGIRKITFCDLCMFYKLFYRVENMCISIISNIYLENSFLNKIISPISKKNTKKSWEIFDTTINKISENGLMNACTYIFWIVKRCIYKPLAYADILESVSLTLVEEIIKEELQLSDDNICFNIVSLNTKYKIYRMIIRKKTFMSKIYLVLNDIVIKVKDKKVLIDNIIYSYKQFLSSENVNPYIYINYMGDCFVYGNKEYDNNDLVQNLSKISGFDIIQFITNCFKEKYYIYRLEDF